MRKRRSQGRRPWVRDLLLLSQHHSKPCFRELVADHMGPKNTQQWQSAPWKGKQKHSDADNGYSGSWSFWPGTWKQRNQDVRKTQQQDTTHFPSYVDMTVSKQSMSTAALPLNVSQGTDVGSSPDGDFLKTVQKNLNSNRRIEGRLRKLNEDSQHKQAQWQQFEANLKELFMQERAKFQQDMEAIAKESQELEQQKNAALQTLLEVLEQRNAPMSGMAVEKPASNADAAAWDSFVSEAQRQGAQAQIDADRDLASALLAAQSPASLAELLRGQMQGPSSNAPTPGPATPCSRGTSAVPRTPPRPHATGIASQQAPGTGIGSMPQGPVGIGLPLPFASSPVMPNASSDPYMASPTLHAARADNMGMSPIFGTHSAAEAPHATGASAVKARSAFGKAGERIPVKKATRTPASPSPPHCSQNREEMLMAKRAALAQGACLGKGHRKLYSTTQRAQRGVLHPCHNPRNRKDSRIFPEGTGSCAGVTMCCQPHRNAASRGLGPAFPYWVCGKARFNLCAALALLCHVPCGS